MRSWANLFWQVLIGAICRFAERLAADQQAILKPDVDTPFVDAEDVVRRLLPYHIYQQPKEDLEKLISPKGKGKAEDDLRSEIEGTYSVRCRRNICLLPRLETKFALECHKRKRKLHDRLYNMRVREGRVSHLLTKTLFPASDPSCSDNLLQIRPSISNRSSLTRSGRR